MGEHIQQVRVLHLEGQEEGVLPSAGPGGGAGAGEEETEEDVSWLSLSF